jgi:hypothetical protein
MRWATKKAKCPFRPIPVRLEHSVWPSQQVPVIAAEVSDGRDPPRPLPRAALPVSSPRAKQLEIIER